MPRSRRTLIAGLVFAAAFSALAFRSGVLTPAPAATAATVRPGVLPGSVVPTPAPLRLQGEVLDVPDGTAISSVRVEMHGVSLPATVSGRSFSVTVPTRMPATMMRVVATAGSIRYVSVVGTVDRVRRLGGADALANAAEVPALRVGAFTSALAVMERHVLARDASTDAEFEDVLRYLNDADLANTQYLLVAYARGERPLPQGFTNGFDAVSDQEAVRTAMTDIDGNQHWWTPPAIDTALAQPTLAPVASLDGLPADLLLRSANAPGELPLTGGVWLLSRGSGGAYEFREPVATTNPRHTVSLLNGTVVLAPSAPRSSVGYYSVQDNPYATGVYTADGIELRRMTAGDRYAMWALVISGEITFPDYPGEPARPFTSLNYVVSTDFAAAVRTGAWSAVSGTRRALPVGCISDPGIATPVLTACGSALHRFDSTGAGATEDVGFKVNDRMEPQAGVAGEAFSWSAGNTTLTIETPSTLTTVWSTGSAGGVDPIVYAQSATINGKTVSRIGTSVSILTSPFALSSSQVPGTWESGLVRSGPISYPDPEQVFQFVRYADGSAQHLNYYERTGSSTLQKWSLVDGRLYEFRSRARMPSGTRYVIDCATAFAQGASTCSIVRTRYLRVLRQVGRRLYGIEELATQPFVMQSPGDTTPFDVSRDVRPNYYECVAGECTSWMTAGLAPRPLSTTTNRTNAMQERRAALR